MKASMTSISLFRLFGVALLVAAGCGSSSNAGPSGSGGSSSGKGGTTASGSAGSTGSGVAGTSGAAGSSGGTTASGAAGAGAGGSNTGAGGTNTVDAGKLGTTQCSDGIDNDGDGLIDLADPECVGPLDNDESSFATGIPGDNIDPCKQDCFFDGNSGMGDDGCLWQLKCDPLSTEAKCPYDSQYAAQHTMECSVSASQSAMCVSKCQALVPNGCDCFGCCLIPGAPTAIRLAATCTAADFNNPAKCPPCTQVTQCSNPCGHCELCIGKTTLPPDCSEGGGDGGVDGSTDGPPGQQCGSDFVPCGPGTSIPLDGCQTGYGCITGCCIPTSIQ